MKILLIEDEPQLVSIIQRDLTAEGHEISVAMDGITGLDMAIRMDFQLIILDIMLPGINGIELCRNLRQANPNRVGIDADSPWHYRKRSDRFRCRCR
jgi:DNA-binding response OmpR family regulator